MKDPKSQTAIPDIQHGCACFSLRKAARMMAQVYDRHLQPADLKNTQFALLATLSLEGPLSVNALAEEMAMDRTTLTRNLKVLDRRDLVKIGPGPDARTKSIDLTRAGRARLKKALPLWQNAQAHVLNQFGSGSWRTLQKELKEMEELARAFE